MIFSNYENEKFSIKSFVDDKSVDLLLSKVNNLFAKRKLISFFA